MASQCSWFSWHHHASLKCAPSPHPGSLASLSWQQFEEIPGLSTFSSWSKESRTRQLQGPGVLINARGLSPAGASELSSWLVHGCLSHPPAKSFLVFCWITDPLWALTLSWSPRPVVDWFFSGEMLLSHTKCQKALGKITAYLSMWIVCMGLEMRCGETVMISDTNPSIFQNETYSLGNFCSETL